MPQSSKSGVSTELIPTFDKVYRYRVNRVASCAALLTFTVRRFARIGALLKTTALHPIITWDTPWISKLLNRIAAANMVTERGRWGLVAFNNLSRGNTP